MICFTRTWEHHCFFAIFFISESFIHFNDKVFVLICAFHGWCCNRNWVLLRFRTTQLILICSRWICYIYFKYLSMEACFLLANICHFESNLLDAADIRPECGVQLIYQIRHDFVQSNFSHMLKVDLESHNKVWQ